VLGALNLRPDSHRRTFGRQLTGGLWNFLETRGIEPLTVDEVFSVGVRALRQSVIWRKISQGVQSASGAVCRTRLPTVTPTLRRQGCNIWQFL
jgi:hypothetical protein